ncbi:MAG: TSUP family transporter [Methylococcales bacterium]
MALDIVLTVLITTIIQSVFGVGVLLFGTPLLLLFGYHFLEALSILLPISLSINAIQIARYYHEIDKDFYIKVLIFTIPLIVISLFLLTRSNIDVGLLVGVFLVFVGMQNYSSKINTMLQVLVRYEKAYLVVMGVVHGLTNLGGSLLTAIVHNKQLPKHSTRATIAAAYASFAVFQIATLLVAAQDLDVNLLNNIVYLIFAIIIYIVAEEAVYVSIDNQQYRIIFSGFLFVSGVLLIVKSLGYVF